MKPVLLRGTALGRFSRLAAVGKTIGSWLIGAAFVALVIFAIATAGKAAAWVQPYVDIFSAAILAVVLPVSLLLLLFRRNRGYGGLGLYFRVVSARPNTLGYVLRLHSQRFCFLDCRWNFARRTRCRTDRSDYDSSPKGLVELRHDNWHSSRGAYIARPWRVDRRKGR